MASYRSEPGRPRTIVVVIGVVLLVVVAAIVVIAGGLFRGDGGADGSAPPSVSSAATAVPSGSAPAPSTPVASASGAPAGLAVDGLARTTVSGLNVRREPSTAAERLGSLEAGEVGYVLDGPVSADGTEWVLLSALGLPPNAGCEEPIVVDPFTCPTWIGWVALGSPDDASAWLEPTIWDCPSPADYAEFAALTPVLRLVCAGGTAVELTAWWAGPDPAAGCIDAPPRVDWLFCPWALGGSIAESGDDPGLLAMPVAVDPESGVSMPPAGRMVALTGHFDDPAASDCIVVPGNLGDSIAGAAQVLQCRSTLVVDSMVGAP